jgi:hypothetical protein
MKEPNVICQTCQKTFFKEPRNIKRTNNHFCSKECSDDYRRSKKLVSCTNCEKIIEIFPGQYKRSQNHFCSRSCSVSFNNSNKTYGNRRSKLEIYLEEQIKLHYWDLTVEYNKKLMIRSELDLYFPELNFAIEINGIMHYQPIYGQEQFIKIQANDKKKVNACKEKGIQLEILDISSCKRFTPEKKEEYRDIVFDMIEKRLASKLV